MRRRDTRLSALLLVLSTIACLMPTALADHLPPVCYRDGDTNEVICTAQGHGSDGDTTGGSNSGGGDEYPYRLLWSPELQANPDGGLCIGIVYERIGREPTDSDELASELQFLRWLRVYPVCPGVDGPPTTTPEIEAESFIRRISFPTAVPTIAPGSLPVGLEAYLETGIPSTVTPAPHPTPFGELRVTATAEIYVDWDDPHDATDGEDGPYLVDGRPAEPGPYPTGEIRHVYQYDGRHQVRVRYVWTADWSIGPESGTVTGLETVGTYPAPGFEAFSREAVG